MQIKASRLPNAIDHDNAHYSVEYQDGALYELTYSRNSRTWAGYEIEYSDDGGDYRPVRRLEPGSDEAAEIARDFKLVVPK